MVQKDGGAPVLKVVGRFDAMTSPRLEKEIDFF